MRKLLSGLDVLAAMLLLCGVTEAATPTDNLPIAVTSANAVACDIGPAAAIPAAAQAAGLTHCVANFDFSQPTYAVPAFDPTGRPGSWANCFGENNGIPGIIWHGGASGILQAEPCDIKQKADPLDGSTVMNFEWRPTFTPRGGNIGPALMTFNQMVSGGPDGRGIPTVAVGNYYVETINHFESTCTTPQCPVNSSFADVYMYPLPGEYGTEIDITEFQQNGTSAGNCGYSNGGEACWSNWDSNAPIIGISNFKNTDLHTYGALSTSDGKTDKRVCMYIDDILQNTKGCLVEAGAAVGQPDTNFLSRYMVSVGAAGLNGITIPVEWDVKNIIVWSCNAYTQSGAAGMCNGTSLVTQTLPTGQTLSYYH